MDVGLETNIFPEVASIDCRPELAAPALVGNAFRAIYETFLRRLIVWEGGIFSSNEAESEDGCAWMACRCVAAAFENIGMEKVIAVQKAEPGSRGVLQSKVSCAGYSSMFLRQQSNAWITRGVFLDDLAGAVGRAVVDAEAFPVGTGLREDGIQCSGQVFLYVEDGCDDGKERHS